MKARIETEKKMENLPIESGRTEKRKKKKKKRRRRRMFFSLLMLLLLFLPLFVLYAQFFTTVINFYLSNRI